MKYFFFIFFVFFLSTSISKNTFGNEIQVNLIRLKNDPEHKTTKGYAGYILEKKYPLNRSILMAIKENKFKLNSLNIKINLSEHLINNLDELPQYIQKCF